MERAETSDYKSANPGSSMMSNFESEIPANFDNKLHQWFNLQQNQDKQKV